MRLVTRGAPIAPRVSPSAQWPGWRTISGPACQANCLVPAAGNMLSNNKSSSDNNNRIRNFENFGKDTISKDIFPRTRVGSFSWVLGHDCKCGANLSPAFILDMTGLIFKTGGRHLHGPVSSSSSSGRQPVVV